MVAVLPVEIWREVATHVPADRLQELYSVNCTFFYVAMEAKYQDVHLLSKEQCLRNIHRLEYPIASRHVRSLHLSLRALVDEKWKGLCKEIIAAMFRPHRTTKSTKQLLRFIRGLTGLTSLNLTDSYISINHRDFPQFVRVMKAGCATFGPTLRSLNLNLSPEVFHRTLSPLLLFPCLEVLRIKLSCVFANKTTIQLLCDVFAPFINNHQVTLRTLGLDFHTPLPGKLDICSALLGLRHLPRLTTLDIRPIFLNMSHFDNPGLKHIFEIHAEQLEELYLHIACNYLTDAGKHFADSVLDKCYRRGFLHVHFKHLKVFGFQMEMFPNLCRTAQYLHRFEDTLTTLNLVARRLSFDDVETVADAFTRRNILKNFTMDVRFLTPQLLALLATKLSALEDLYLKCSEFGTEHPVPLRLSPNQFCRDIVDSRDSYTGWKLRILTAWTMINGPENVGVCENAFRVALPSLETLRLESFEWSRIFALCPPTNRR